MSMLHGDQEMLVWVLTLHPHGKLHWSWGEWNLSLGLLPREKGDAHRHCPPCLAGDEHPAAHQLQEEHHEPLRRGQTLPQGTGDGALQRAPHVGPPYTQPTLLLPENKHKGEPPPLQSSPKSSWVCCRSLKSHLGEETFFFSHLPGLFNYTIFFSLRGCCFHSFGLLRFYHLPKNSLLINLSTAILKYLNWSPYFSIPWWAEG